MPPADFCRRLRKEKTMILYKNVDISDLPSIRDLSALVSIDDLGYSNWDDGKRARNATNVVYLFKPLPGKPNSFPAYGAALLEMDIPDEWLEEHEIAENDYNYGMYTEYICREPIPTECIRCAYIPDLPGKYNPESLEGWPVRLCDFTGEAYNDDVGAYEPASEETLRQFKSTVNTIQSTGIYGYFRGANPDRSVLDLKNITYKIKK